MNKSGTVLLISPSMFSYSIEEPFLSVPLLSGKLKSAGFKTICRDFNLELHKDIKNKTFIENSYKKFKERLPLDENGIQDTEYKKSFLKHKIALEMYQSILSLPEPPSNLLYDFIQLPYKIKPAEYTADYEDIRKQADDRSSNFFTEYYEEKIKTLPEDVMMIVISSYPIYDLYKIYPVLTLSKMLKDRYKNAEIILAYDYFSCFKTVFEKHPEFFDAFCDFVLYGSCENGITELAECVKNGADVSCVSNLIYKNSENKVIINAETKKQNINESDYADYDGYNLAEYETPYKIPMILSKGCYWNKCRFCTYGADKAFQIKTINNAAGEIKYYIDKYGIKSVHFQDNAVSAHYYDKLSDTLLENNIKIQFNSFAIFEEGFTAELLAKMKQAGCTRLSWGLDTHSKRIFKLSNKSGCFEKRAEILKNSFEAGIQNNINIIEGLPLERLEDLIQTVKFMYDNIEYINKFNWEKFQIRTGSYFLGFLEEYGLKITGKEDFSPEYQYINEKTDINKSNSFYERIKGLSRYDKEGFRHAAEEYLKQYAPD